MNDYTQTPNFGLYKPEVNADYDLWGDHLNANADILDGLLNAAQASISDTAPASPRAGQLWFDTVNAQLYVWDVDPTSSQWVIATAQNSAALVSDLPPSNPTPGMFWFHGISAQLFVWYVDPTGPGQWVPANVSPATTLVPPIMATGSTTPRPLEDRFSEVANVKDYGAKGDTIGLTDGTMTIGSNAFSSVTATFTAADVGKAIIVTGAGAGNTPLKGTITAFTDAHHVTLSFNAAVAVPWSAAGIPVGGFFYYGTDDTPAVRAAIAAGQAQRKTVYFPSGCYWLASQTTAISLSGVALRGEGNGTNYYPYTGDRGSVVLLSNAATAAFNGVAGTTVTDVGFFYPAIDPSQATPISLPPLFEADAASNSYVNNWFTRVRVIAADTVFHVTAAGSLARTFVTDCMLYGVRNVFWLQNGYADTVQPLNNYFGCGAAGVLATGGNAYLQKYTRANGAVFRYDIAAGSNAVADGLIWTGGIVQGYRYGILIASGTLDVNNIANVNFDFSGSVLTVLPGALIVSTAFAGGEIYSTGPDPTAIDDVFYFASGATVGSSLAISGIYIAYALGNVINDVSGAITSLVFAACNVQNWGRSTTAGAYYVYSITGGGQGAQVFSGNSFFGNRLGTSNSIDGIVTAHTSGGVTITGNMFNTCTRPILLAAGSGYRVTISGNTSINSGAASLDNSTATVVYGANNFDLAPAVQTSRATMPINVVDFGAAGDGVTDDTAAFQAAAAAVPSAGACIYVPSGTFLVGAAILLKANTHLRGNGTQATTLKMKNSTNVAGLIGNAVNGSSFISVTDLTVDGNKANNGAGTSQGINMVQVSQVTLRNVEVANVNGYGVTISGNGVNTTRGAHVSRVYIHNCDLTGFSVTFACRQTVINGLTVSSCGSTGNPTFAAIFLDASECITSNVLADSNISDGIHIHNVFGCTYDGLTATRNGRHGINVEVLTTSTGANWRAQSNGTQTANTYDDIHFFNTNIASPGYGITANCQVDGITVGPDANFSGFLTERYGLYIEDTINSNVHLANVQYVGTSMTGNVRLPAAMGTLVVDVGGGVPDAPSDGSTYGRLNAAWSKALPLTGGTLTGGLTISNGNQLTAQNPAVQFGAIANASFSMLLVGASGGIRAIQWFSNTNAGTGLRWQLGTDNVAEGGSNAGSNYNLTAYSDTGTVVGTALSFARASMQVTFAGPVRMNGTVGFNNTAPIAKPTGWGTSTGGARAAITASSTLPQVAAAVAQLLTDLQAYGLIGV